MSGLARVALQRGAAVSGTDRAEGPAVEQLRAEGADIRIGHDADLLPDGPVEIVRSTAITEEHPEYAAALARGDVILHRSDLLAQLVADRRTIAVAGAHGKTTTSSMIAHALHQLGADPSWVIGGTVRSLGSRSAHWGGEDGWLVVEADESDRSFLRLRPQLPVVTNIELDHDARDLAALKADFTQFLDGCAQVAVLPRDLAEVSPRAGATLVDLPAGDPWSASTTRASRSGWRCPGVTTPGMRLSRSRLCTAPGLHARPSPRRSTISSAPAADLNPSA